MIEPTKENADLLRDGYYETLEATMLKAFKEGEQFIFDTEEEFEGHTEEQVREFQEMMKNYKLPDESYAAIRDNLDLSKRAGHSMVTDFGVDLRPYIEDMAELDHEVYRFLVFGYETYIGTIQADDNDETSVAVTNKQYKELLEMCEGVSLPRVITVHNHPNCFAAIPSFNDGKLAMAHKFMLKRMFIELYDDLVICPMDLYSRRQDEKKREKASDVNDRVILNPIMPDELALVMHKKNKYMYGAITGHMKLNPDKPGI